MNAFDEFIQIATRLEDSSIAYAVVGGVAMAFHNYFRYTEDIDLIIADDSLKKIEDILINFGYIRSAPPWRFTNSPFTIHRFIKAADDDQMIIDLLTSSDQTAQTMIDNADVASGPDGRVRVVQKQDLIALKRMRNSAQDKADIERLENEPS